MRLTAPTPLPKLSVRVWRWTAALFFPLLKALVLLMTKYIWIPLVHQQNNKHQFNQHRKRQRRNATALLDQAVLETLLLDKDVLNIEKEM